MTLSLLILTLWAFIGTGGAAGDMLDTISEWRQAR